MKELKCVGSRACHTYDFNKVCQDRKLDPTKSLHTVYKDIILKHNFVVYCYKFIAYKFGVVNPPSDIVLKWSRDEWLYNTKVYRESLEEDRLVNLNILQDLNRNFERSIQDSSK